MILRIDEEETRVTKCFRMINAAGGAIINIIKKHKKVILFAVMFTYAYHWFITRNTSQSEAMSGLLSLHLRIIIYNIINTQETTIKIIK